MAIQLREIQAHRTWFRDTDQLPGWTVEWQMGRAANGTLTVSALKITRTPNTALVARAHPGGSEWSAACREMFNPETPGTGITTAFLRRVRLGLPARVARRAIATDALDGVALKAPRRKVGAPPTRTRQWWVRLAARRDALYQSGRKDWARALANEYGAKEGTMRMWISRCEHREKLPLSRQRVVPTAKQARAMRPDRPFLDYATPVQKVRR